MSNIINCLCALVSSISLTITGAIAKQDYIMADSWYPTAMLVLGTILTIISLALLIASLTHARK